ncbi:Hypothetical_protein [Hexamita inflata]|uniref:Hypothetical_protein n=1 Tax=Hexamita inflata TaxID=28002 RepID=A0ABP1JW60_9EUKA
MFGHLCHGQLDSRKQQFPKILLSPTLQPNQVYCVSVSLAVEVGQLWNRIQYFQIWRDQDIFKIILFGYLCSATASWIPENNNFRKYYYLQRCSQIKYIVFLCLQLLKQDSSGTAFNIFKSGETQDIFKIILFGYLCSATASWIPEINNFRKYYYLQRCSQIKYIVFLELSSVSLAVEVGQLWNRIQYFQIWRDPRYFQNNSVWISLSRPAGFQKLIISKNIIISNVAAKSSILFFWNCLLCLQLLKLDSSGTAFNIFKSGETQDIFKIILFGHLCHGQLDSRKQQFPKILLSPTLQPNQVYCVSVSLAVEVGQLWNRIQYFQIWRDQDIFKFLCLDISATASWIPEINNFQKYYYLQRCSQIKYIVFQELSSVSLAVEVGQLWNRIQYFQIWRDPRYFQNNSVWISLLCHGQLDSRKQQFPKILLSPTLQPNQVYCVSGAVFCVSSC